ncbi:glycosyltransferase family 2 protein [Paenibacillus sp. RS8]|uniref:glycosyltransferase family 2 protein n=1 Tax=Paenibacillus sp. RS8 TaxID=3242681 RepID=UPI0035C094AB
MSHESLNVERLAGRYGFLERAGLLPLPSHDGISIVVELSRMECATVCLPLLLLHSGADVRIIAVSMTPDFPMEVLAGQFSPEEPVIFLPYEKEEYMPNLALAHIETDFAVLVEDSIMVSPGWLSELLWTHFDDASVRVIAPRSSTERGEGKKRLHFGTHHEFAEHVSYSLGRYQGEWREMEVLTGSCLLFTKELIQRIGGFDTSLQARHLMIADWCLRARQIGAKLALSEAVYVHAIQSLDRYLRNKDESKQTDGWQTYYKKWALESGGENEGHLVPPAESLKIPQPVIPLGRLPLASPLVTAIVYGDEAWDFDELKEQWIAAREQQSYKHIRWIWVRDTLVDAAPEFPASEHDVVITVRGEDAWLRALKNAAALYESEIILYLSTSIHYEKRYIERVVKAITQGSADLIVSLSTEMEEAGVHLLAGGDSALTLPLERVAYKGGIVPGMISNRKFTSRQLLLHPNASLVTGYIGDLSDSKEAHP